MHRARGFSNSGCSTPFGIKDHFTRKRHCCRCKHMLVLNAFRHQRSFHPDTRPYTKASPWCSTPFGIKDHFTAGKQAQHTLTTSAQRLSASKIISQIKTGIIKRIHNVLNAFRHQRSFHTRVLPLAMAVIGAQRLSASKIISHFNAKTTLKTIASAQRLSASKIISHKHKVKNMQGHRCSTPFGIKDHFTPGYVPPTPSGLQVLNAFRHQRSFHIESPALGGGAFSAQRLSASKIISRIITNSSIQSIEGAQRLSASDAQRLSASKIISPSAWSIFHAADKVLNAFRHQRSFHAEILGQTDKRVSAQRLSASKIISRIITNSSIQSIEGAQRLSASKIISQQKYVANSCR